MERFHYATQLLVSLPFGFFPNIVLTMLQHAYHIDIQCQHPPEFMALAFHANIELCPQCLCSYIQKSLTLANVQLIARGPWLWPARTHYCQGLHQPRGRQNPSLGPAHSDQYIRAPTHESSDSRISPRISTPHAYVHNWNPNMSANQTPLFTSMPKTVAILGPTAVLGPPAQGRLWETLESKCC